MLECFQQSRPKCVFVAVVVVGKPTDPGLRPCCGQKLEGVLVAGEVTGHWARYQTPKSSNRALWWAGDLSFSSWIGSSTLPTSPQGKKRSRKKKKGDGKKWPLSVWVGKYTLELPIRICEKNRNYSSLKMMYVLILQFQFFWLFDLNRFFI